MQHHPGPAPRFDPVGDSAIAITLGASADERTRVQVHRYYERLRSSTLHGVHDIVPGFTTITVHYDPALVEHRGASGDLMRSSNASGRAPFDAAVALVREALAADVTESVALSRLIEIPACYDAAVAPDLREVAAHAGIMSDEVAELHAAAEYVVHMVGFLPGFPYLGGLDSRLAMPRRASPRTRVPAGSVAIGGAHTGIYTIESPGGWHVIGRTAMRLFDVDEDPPAMLRIGDRVRFRPIAIRDLESAIRT